MRFARPAEPRPPSSNSSPTLTRPSTCRASPSPFAPSCQSVARRRAAATSSTRGRARRLAAQERRVQSSPRESPAASVSVVAPCRTPASTMGRARAVLGDLECVVGGWHKRFMRGDARSRSCVMSVHVYGAEGVGFVEAGPAGPGSGLRAVVRRLANHAPRQRTLGDGIDLRGQSAHASHQRRGATDGGQGAMCFREVLGRRRRRACGLRVWPQGARAARGPRAGSGTAPTRARPHPR